MPDVAFVAPYAMESTLRFVRGALKLPGVRVGLISQEPAERLPEDLRERLAGFQRVADAMETEQLAGAVRALARQWNGKVDRLIGILEQLQVPMAEVRELLGIRGMDRREATHFRDKSAMKDVLRRNGLPCARHGLAESAEQALAFAREAGLPLVVKPPAGAGAKSTFRVDRLEDLEDYLLSLPPLPAQPVLLEEFITGEEYSFDTVTLHGRHVFHSISRYYPPPLQVVENPWIQWCVLLPRDVSGGEYDDIRAAGRAALDCLGMVTGISHMEWFRREGGGIAISEVAARPPGAQFTSLMSYAHDRDFYQEWPRIMVFEEFDPPERRYAAGAAYLRGQGRGRVSALEGLERVQRELGGLVVEAKLPKVGQTPSGSYEGEGYVILRHPDTEVVKSALERLVNMVRVQLA